MAHNNRYFIINANDPNLMAIIAFCVGNLGTQRYSIDKTKLVIKLCEGDDSTHEELSGYTEYNHEQILAALENSEWVNDV